MPPHSRSRYLASLGIQDDSLVFFLTEREPIRWDPEMEGTRRHVVAQGDLLPMLAYRYFQPIPDAEHLWWVIAEFQPTPIFDLTLDLAVGRVLYVPSVRMVQERFLAY
jgi:hypothetical protein